MAVQPEGSVTFLFTDVEGSTRLLERLGGERYANVLQLHRRLLRNAFARHDGYEVDSEGDAFFVAFSRPDDAVAAAAEAQQALTDADWPDGQKVRVRMGIHTGEPLVVRPKYVGLDVHKAARIMAAGHGGQVLLSEATRRLVPDADALGLGEHRLKDLLRPEQLYQLRVAGSPSSFPALKTLGNRPTNLPVQPNPLVGREQEIDALIELLRKGTVRLVTLTGPGGTGKTRLALQVGAELLEAFPSGVFFVSIAHIRDSGLVLPAVAQALAVRDVTGEALIDTLAAYLEQKHMLLVIDNFEQVVDAAGALGALLERCTNLKVLVTSRERLRLAAEHIYAVPPLTLPDAYSGFDAVRASEAVALFIARAQRATGSFVLGEKDAPIVAEICARLDGLPLAIELAAAQTVALAPAALQQRLAQRLPLLRGGTRDAPPRQQTLRDTIEWSYELLSPSEQRLFGQLSIFVDGCRLDAAEAICDAGTGSGTDVLEGITSLVDKNLLRRRQGSDGEPRYWMLETIREYAEGVRERTREAGDLTKRAASYWLEWALRAEPELVGPKPDAWRTRLSDDEGNLRWTLRTFLETERIENAVRLTAALASAWLSAGNITEAWRLVSEVLERASGEPAAVRAPLLQWAPFFALFVGDGPAGEALALEARQACTAVEDHRGSGRALNALAFTRPFPESARLLEESFECFRAAGDRWGLARAYLNLGSIHVSNRNAVEARDALAHCVEICDELGDDETRRIASSVWGMSLLDEGDLDQAEALLIASLAPSSESDMRQTAHVLLGLAVVACSRGNMAEAIELIVPAATLEERQGFRFEEDERRRLDGVVDVARAAMSRESFAVAWQRAAERPINEIVDGLLTDDRSRPDEVAATVPVLIVHDGASESEPSDPDGEG